jgi:hypothetical protein
MQVTVAHAAEQNLDGDVLWSWRAAIDGVRPKRRGRGLGGISFGLHGNSGKNGGKRELILGLMWFVSSPSLTLRAFVV